MRHRYSYWNLVMVMAILFSLTFFNCFVWAASPDEIRPYSDDSPWNLKIGPTPEYDPQSDAFTSAMKDIFGCDTSQFTLPVYIVGPQTPVKEVSLSGIYSEVTNNGKLVVKKKAPTLKLPLPDKAEPAKGSDAQIIIWNPATGDEWGLWKVEITPSGYKAKNGYYYNTKWSGVPPFGFMSRGAGVPYLTGLVRPWEIKSGKIDHALALGLNYPSAMFIHPATKSDGQGLFPSLPSGARLQLDPNLTEKDFDNWGLDKSGKILAKAMQEYGLIVIDSAGHPKVYLEYDATAQWQGLINKKTIKPIPYSAFRVLPLNAPSRPGAVGNLGAKIDGQKVILTWSAASGANRYWIKKKGGAGTDHSVLARDIAALAYEDATVQKGQTYEYIVVGASHNGLGPDSSVVKVKVP